MAITFVITVLFDVIVVLGLVAILICTCAGEPAFEPLEEAHPQV